MLAGYVESKAPGKGAADLTREHAAFGNVSKEMWESGIFRFEVVKSWLGYRMKDRKGKCSSSLDKIRPKYWVFDEESLNLLWILEHTLVIYPAVEHWLSQIAEGTLLAATDFPAPVPYPRNGNVCLYTLWERNARYGLAGANVAHPGDPLPDCIYIGNIQQDCRFF